MALLFRIKRYLLEKGLNRLPRFVKPDGIRCGADAVCEEFVVHCLEGHWPSLACREFDLGSPPSIVRRVVLPVCTRYGNVVPRGPQRP